MQKKYSTINNFLVKNQEIEKLIFSNICTLMILLISLEG